MLDDIFRRVNLYRREDMIAHEIADTEETPVEPQVDDTPIEETTEQSEEEEKTE